MDGLISGGGMAAGGGMLAARDSSLTGESLRGCSSAAPAAAMPAAAAPVFGTPTGRCEAKALKLSAADEVVGEAAGRAAVCTASSWDGDEAISLMVTPIGTPSVGSPMAAPGAVVAAAGCGASKGAARYTPPLAWVGAGGSGAAVLGIPVTSAGTIESRVGPAAAAAAAAAEEEAEKEADARRRSGPEACCKALSRSTCAVVLVELTATPRSSVSCGRGGAWCGCIGPAPISRGDASAPVSAPTVSGWVLLSLLSVGTISSPPVGRRQKAPRSSRHKRRTWMYGDGGSLPNRRPPSHDLQPARPDAIHGCSPAVQLQSPLRRTQRRGKTSRGNEFSQRGKTGCSSLGGENAG